jgi:hypothetical protein
VEDKQWLALMGLSERHPRMNDCELVLRFFALRDALPNYSPPLKTLLSDFMKTHRHAEADEINELRSAFFAAVRPVVAGFDGYPFRRFMPSRKDPSKIDLDKSVNRAVFDVQMLVMEGLDEDWVADNQKAIVVEFVKLCLVDAEFGDAVSKATADKSRMEYRLRAFRAVLETLGAQLPNAARLP